MTFKAHKFAYNHPKFGKSKFEKDAVPYKNSVYYLWWEFLRKNSEYEKCCKSRGKGSLESLYTDFGNVHSGDFKTWWQTNDRGAYLFAEKSVPQFMLLSDFENIVPDARVLYVQVPLALPKKYLEQQFHTLLKKHHSGQRGRRNNEKSTARYPIVGHVDTDALQKCLRAYETRERHQGIALWEIAQKGKLTTPKQFIKNDGTETKAEIVSKKNILANTASRLLKKAESIIKNTAEGRFPAVGR